MDDRLMLLSPADRGRINREIGEEIWRRKKEDEAKFKRQEMIQCSREPIYWPFGLAGGGAPNPLTVRRQKLRNHLPARLCSREPIYWPFGLAGGGAPNPLTVRRQKLRNHLPARLEDGPLPNLPCLRRRVKFSDPELRFQNHPDVRRSVEIHWRYGLPKEIKSAYRMDLERQMEEKRLRRVDDRKICCQQLQCGMTTDFGRPGPGGTQWRHPSKIGMNFLHSLGWTGEKAFRRLEDQLEGRNTKQLMIKDKSQAFFATPEEALTGGVELVPLMARRRSFKKSSHLPSCDVTNAASTHGKESWQDTPGPLDYLRDLDAQVSDKRGQAKAQREDSLKTARQHFETWNALWGRPGHGAPRAGGMKNKENLGKLLYRESGVLWPAATAQRVR